MSRRRQRQPRAEAFTRPRGIFEMRNRRACRRPRGDKPCRRRPHGSCTVAVGYLPPGVPVVRDRPAPRRFVPSFVLHPRVPVGRSRRSRSLSTGCGGGGSDSTSPGGSGNTGSPLGSATGNVSGRIVSVPIDGSPLEPLVVPPSSVPRSATTSSPAPLGNLHGVDCSCTHEINQITNFTGSQSACTFHGSMYTTSGTVARGPATRP